MLFKSNLEYQWMLMWVQKSKKKKKKKKNVCKKGYIWNPITCSCENCRHENWSIINDSIITCDIILETIESILTKTVLL